MNRGFWIFPFPSGTIVDLGGMHHIDLVIDKPLTYGENIEDIKEAYDRFNEGWRHEGKARDEIMQRVVKRGFIRIRENRNRWKIQLWELDPDKSQNLSNWAKFIIATDKRDRYGDALIMDISRVPQRWEHTTLIKLSEL